MKTKSPLVIPILALALLIWLPGCSDDEETPTDSGNGDMIEISMQNIAFSPANITIDSGQTVVWINRDNVPHTATSGTPQNQTGVFDSGTMNNGDQYEFTFMAVGTFDYFCEFHPTQMTATITVQ
jgi:plastocyanin